MDLRPRCNGTGINLAIDRLLRCKSYLFLKNEELVRCCCPADLRSEDTDLQTLTVRCIRYIHPVSLPLGQTLLTPRSNDF